MTNGIWLVILGTFLVAIGGLFATHGWNKHSIELANAALRDALLVELDANWQILNDKIFTDDASEKGATVLFPRVLDVALSGVIAVGGLSASSGNDVLSQAIRLKQRIGMFNQRLEFAETAAMHDARTVAKSYPAIRGSMRQQIISEMLVLCRLLDPTCRIGDQNTHSVNLNR